MEKRIDIDVLNNHFSSSSCATSSFYTTSELLPLSTPLPSTSSFSVGLCTTGGGLSYIQHSVSKFDTLAGVAIKYGVEVADIKMLNGLVTDHQMFARKTLHIPSPGRYPPSAVVSDAPDNHGQIKSDLFKSFKLGSSPLLNASPAMSTLQGGLEPAEEESHSKGSEMAMYLNGGSHAPFTKSVIPPNAPLSRHRKCKSVAYDLYAKSIQANQEEAKENGVNKWIDNLSQWRKSEVDLMSKAPETLLKEEVNSSGGFSAVGSSRGLALRPKAVARVASGPNSGGFPNGLGGSARANISNGVRKSSSTPSLQEAENGISSSSSSSWLKSKWNLKPDSQALSTSAITKPILDGLPLTKAGKKSK